MPDPTLATAEFLRCWLLTDKGMTNILEASLGAAGPNRRLGLTKLMLIPVPLPSMEEQKQLTRLSLAPPPSAKANGPQTQRAQPQHREKPHPPPNAPPKDPQARRGRHEPHRRRMTTPSV